MANAGDRTRAYRLRAKLKQGEALDPADQLWLAEYEERQQGTGHGSIGASATERIINIEERAAAVGTGTAAEAAAAAAMAREEGRRIDYLAKTGIEALTKSFEMQLKLNEIMMQRMLQMEDVHLGMLGAVREQYLARTQAEIESMHAQAEDEDSPINALVQILLARMNGGKPIALPTSTSKHRTQRGAKSK